MEAGGRRIKTRAREKIKIPLQIDLENVRDSIQHFLNRYIFYLFSILNFLKFP